MSQFLSDFHAISILLDGMTRMYPSNTVAKTVEDTATQGCTATTGDAWAPNPRGRSLGSGMTRAGCCPTQRPRKPAVGQQHKLQLDYA